MRVFVCRECTLEGSEFPWCAVEVDGAGRLVDGRWGKCDMSTCPVPTSDLQDAEEPRSITLTLPSLTGIVEIEHTK